MIVIISAFQQSSICVYDFVIHFVFIQVNTFDVLQKWIQINKTKLYHGICGIYNICITDRLCVVKT